MSEIQGLDDYLSNQHPSRVADNSESFVISERACLPALKTVKERVKAEVSRNNFIWKTYKRITRISKKAQWVEGKTAKWLLCVPRGGLNDTLCQIQLCLEYAQKYNRTVFIDTRKSGIRARLSQYFELEKSNSNIVLYPNGGSSPLWNKDYYPNCIKHESDEVISEYDPEVGFVEELTKVPLRFDMSRDYGHQLLYYEQCGGGSYGWKTLIHFRFIDSIRNELRLRLESLPEAYVGMHIRHSDVKSDYHRFLSNTRTFVAGQSVLLCTDSSEVLKRAKAILSQSSLVLISVPPDTGGLPLHDRQEFTDNAINLSMLADLMALSLSDVIIRPSHSCGYLSGFATLAIELQKRPWIIRQLLGFSPKQLKRNKNHLKFRELFKTREIPRAQNAPNAQGL